MLQDALRCVNGWLGSGRDGARPSESPLLTKAPPELTISGCWQRFCFPQCSAGQGPISGMTTALKNLSCLGAERFCRRSE